MNKFIEIELDVSSHVLGSVLLNVISKYDDNFAVVRAKHCYNEVMVNVEDPKWSSQSFVECIPKLEEATSKSGVNAHSIFLSYLIGDLLLMEVVPVNLIRELVIYYDWPASPYQLHNNLRNTDLLVKALLIKLAEQENINDNEEFVDTRYYKKLGKSELIVFLLSALAIVAWITYKHFK